MKGIPFLIGVWIPAIFGWWESAQQFAIAATIIVVILIATKTMKAI